MTEMTKEKAIELLEKAHSLQEQSEMNNDIRDIDRILSQDPVDIGLVIAKIEEINRKHEENILINHIIFPPQVQGTIFPGRGITDAEYISDLRWKRTYLQAKKVSKAFAELYKEMRKNMI